MFLVTNQHGRLRKGLVRSLREKNQRWSLGIDKVLLDQLTFVAIR